MTSQPVSPEEPEMVQVLDRDPLTNYLGPYCERVTDYGERLDSTVTKDTAEPLVSVILSTNSANEAGSETTVTMTTIKEEPLEFEIDFEEEFEGQLESNLVKEEPSTSQLSSMEANTSHWNLGRIFTELETNEQCVKFAEERGLIPLEKLCSYHRKPLQVSSKMGYLGIYRCRKPRCRSKIVSRTSGTWFENARLPITTIFKIMYMFCHKYTYHDVKMNNTNDNGITLQIGQ